MLKSGSGAQVEVAGLALSGHGAGLVSVIFCKAVEGTSRLRCGNRRVERRKRGRVIDPRPQRSGLNRKVWPFASGEVVRGSRRSALAGASPRATDSGGNATRVRKHRGFAAEVFRQLAATARYRPLLLGTYSPEGAAVQLRLAAKLPRCGTQAG